MYSDTFIPLSLTFPLLLHLSPSIAHTVKHTLSHWEHIYSWLSVVVVVAVVWPCSSGFWLICTLASFAESTFSLSVSPLCLSASFSFLPLPIHAHFIDHLAFHLLSSRPSSFHVTQVSPYSFYILRHVTPSVSFCPFLFLLVSEHIEIPSLDSALLPSPFCSSFVFSPPLNSVPLHASLVSLLLFSYLVSSLPCSCPLLSWSHLSCPHLLSSPPLLLIILSLLYSLSCPRSVFLTPYFLFCSILVVSLSSFCLLFFLDLFTLVFDLLPTLPLVALQSSPPLLGSYFILPPPIPFSPFL